MKIAICYYSSHHQNTLTVLQAMAKECEVDLLDVSGGKTPDLQQYDCVGFASGIYGFEFHPSVISSMQSLPQEKPVFFVYTYGLAKGKGATEAKKIAQQKHCAILGEFSCKGFDTFGPLKAIGGISKGHPNAEELQAARAFFREVISQRN